MENLNVFNPESWQAVSLFGLLVLFLATLFVGRSSKISSSLWLLFWALAFDFAANYMGVKVTDIYNAGGDITLYMLVELLLCLAAMLLMSLSASQFLVHDYPDKIVTLGIAGLGLFAIVFFLLLLPDGVIVNNMRQIFPLAGFSYVALSLWSETRQKNNGGYILAALWSTLAVVWFGLKLFDVPFTFDINVFCLLAAFYPLSAVAFMLMGMNALADSLQKSETEVAKNNLRFQEIIKSSPFPIIISRVVDDKIILANSNAVKLFGINPDEMDRYHFKDFFADSDNRRLLNERLEQERVVQDFEILVNSPTLGTPFWLLASANIIDYNYDLVLYSAFQDITSRKNREVLLKNQATRDPLTALYNRRYFEDEVNKQILKAKSANQAYSVLMLDADLFKRVNDTYGHKVGDKVLIELAATAERALRDKDIVARYGGEEFVVFLPEIPAEQARGVADRVRESISEVVVYSDDNQPVKFTVSIGVSSSAVSDNIDTLIKTADEALYKAKQNGRNRVEVFTPDDWQAYVAQGQKEHKDESQNHHPVFDKEDNVEISLLDGVEGGKLEE